MMPSRTRQAWFDTNFGASVTDTEIADLFAVVSPEGELQYGWVINDKPAPARS